jgi:hypothetical protein
MEDDQYEDDTTAAGRAIEKAIIGASVIGALALIFAAWGIL